MLQQVGPLQAEVREVEGAVGTVVLLHGLGLGPWFWEPWFDTFRTRKLRVVAPVLPGFGDDADPTLQDVVAAVGGVLDAVSGPVTLVGHSAAALVAQLAAVDRDLHALVLMCPVPPGQIAAFPERDVLLKAALPMLPGVFSGKAFKVPWSSYRAVGLSSLEESVARDVYARILPWPAKLTRALARPPKIDPDRMRAPVLVLLGKLDKMLPWARARIIGDLYEGVVWRYDDLGHMPPFDPNGLRMGKDLAKFVLAPIRPKVIESEGYMPQEGVGHDKRKARRGEMMKLRSAYGQKKSAR